MPAKGYSNNKSIYWGTPLDFYRLLDEEFHFDLDPCTMPDNPLGTARFFTEADVGQSQQWSGNVFCNIPYGGANIDVWMEKAVREWLAGRCPVIVMLLPARGFGAKRWHRLVCSCENNPQRNGKTCNGYRRGIEVRMLHGRLKFRNLLDPNYGRRAGTFDSMLVIFRRTDAFIPAPTIDR